MSTIAHTLTWLPIWATLPDISAMPAQEPPKKATSGEVINPDKLLSPASVKQVLLQAVGLGGFPPTDLFAGFTLNTGLVESLGEDWIYAYYLNARYGKSMPDGMLPIRIGSIYSENPYLLAPLMVCSAILMRLWDTTSSTINPEIKRENDHLMRCVVQLNYLIYAIVKSNPGVPKPDGLVVSAFRILDGVEPINYVWLDHELLTQWWEPAGRTAQEAADHWVANKTQPTL